MLSPLLVCLHALSPDIRNTAQRAAPTSTEPTIVTSLLPHKFEQGQANTRVHLDGYNKTELFSGFFTIDAATDSNTYFIYTTPISGRKDAPVLLWLNGGPGASSLLGFFDELGPFGIDTKMDIVERKVSWARDAHLIAMDNPLGVGYSYTGSSARMATNQSTVGADLYEAIRQFMELFPHLRGNDFFVTGESYAGKYVPAAAYTIHERNAHAPPSQHINLKGIAIGDGAFDPPTQFTGFGPLLFNIGLADLAAKRVYEAYDANFTALLDAGDKIAAFRSFDEMLNGDYFGTDRTFYTNTTGMGANYVRDGRSHTRETARSRCQCCSPLALRSRAESSSTLLRSPGRHPSRSARFPRGSPPKRWPRRCTSARGRMRSSTRVSRTTSLVIGLSASCRCSPPFSSTITC